MLRHSYESFESIGQSKFQLSIFLSYNKKNTLFDKNEFDSLLLIGGTEQNTRKRMSIIISHTHTEADLIEIAL